jgi:tRNA (guanine-N(7)-)-methyltransferase subunit TRM82
MLIRYRIMPKRPCAIAVTADDSTIISADKFGDVYSLPLLVSETTNRETITPTTPTTEATPAKPFVSAANHLTVHSQRNRKALENQKKQSNKTTEKLEPMFELKLLLGHVSMLTDLALLTSPEGRNYIVTADRDEHIRVSRGIPQTHIIEGFCLGHTEFISRLCIPKERTDVLLSGGGDDTVFAWDWVSGSVIGREDLRSHVGVLLSEVLGQDFKEGISEPFKVAVSGITHVRLPRSDGVEDLIIVSCEG